MIVCPTCSTPTPEGPNCPSCGTLLSEGADSLIGEVINEKFRIIEPIGVGATGRVYRAAHMALNVDVALKVLHQHRRNDGRLVKQFEREARANSTLAHPNTVEVLDYGTDAKGRMFIAMELLNGQTLAELLAQSGGVLPLQRIVRICTQVLGAIDEAHYNNIVHRDLKPDNIIIEERPGEPDFVTVLDFGTVDEGDFAGRTEIVGTPEYMSPEQARGDVRLDGRSDIYAVGCILYQLVTGSIPFSGDSPLVIATRHLKEPVQPPSQRRPELGIPPEVDGLIVRCMAKDREDRPAHAADLAGELADLLPKGAVDITGRVVFPSGAYDRHGKMRKRPGAASRGSKKTPIIIAAIAAMVVAAVGLTIWALSNTEDDHTEGDREERAVAAVAEPDAGSSALDAGPDTQAPVIEAATVAMAQVDAEEWTLDEDTAEASPDESPGAVADDEEKQQRRRRARRARKRSGSVTDEMLKRAEKYMDEGNTKNAKRLVERVLKREPTNRKAKRLASKLGI